MQAMTLRLLLDEHFSETDAEQLRRRESAIDVVSLHVWTSGAYLRAADALSLAAAFREGRTLVTRDLATISPLLTGWALDGLTHGGVIFVHHRAIPEGNTGALIKALWRLWRETGDDDWTGRIVFLRPANR
jgi:hypothetical protein